MCAATVLSPCRRDSVRSPELPVSWGLGPGTWPPSAVRPQGRPSPRPLGGPAGEGPHRTGRWLRRQVDGPGPSGRERHDSGGRGATAHRCPSRWATSGERLRPGPAGRRCARSSPQPGLRGAAPSQVPEGRAGVCLRSLLMLRVWHRAPRPCPSCFPGRGRTTAGCTGPGWAPGSWAAWTALGRALGAGMVTAWRRASVRVAHGGHSAFR